MPDDSTPPDAERPGTRADWWDIFCKNQEVNDESEFNLVFAGDSITEWINLDYNFPAFAGVFQNFSSKIALGIASDHTQQLLFRMRHNEFRFRSMEKVVVHIGINNLKHGDAPSKLAKGLKRILQRFASMAAMNEIYWLPILPADPQDVEMMSAVEAVNDQVSIWVKETGIATEINCGWETFYNQSQMYLGVGDYTHPGPEGYRRWFTCILPNL